MHVTHWGAEVTAEGGPRHRDERHVQLGKHWDCQEKEQCHYCLVSAEMAKSRYEYVKDFEHHSVLLPSTWVVVRVDGKGFTKFTTEHCFTKPNDLRGLSLMTHCAAIVCKSVPGLVLAYGQSDEYSFVLHKDSQLYSRRTEKIVSTVAAQFAAAFVFYWSHYFHSVTLLRPPSFDARAVMYPSEEILLDYLRWRQTDCHINNLYNTCFWNLVSSGLTETEAHSKLKGTTSAEKNELLFSGFGVNYNEEPEVFRKGTTLVRPDWAPMHADLFQRQFYEDHHVFDSRMSTELPETKPFHRFTEQRKPALKDSHPGLPERDLMKLLSSEWKELSPEAKAAYS